MGARTTLNGIAVTSALAGAALFGSMTQSWLVFLMSFGVLVGMKIHSGTIRPHSNKQRK